MRWILPVALFTTGACSEYDVSGAEAAATLPNPKPLVTPVHTDSYLQREVPKVDIVWVVDNSSSMIEEATKLVENFPIFLNYFLGSGLDYHIGVLSSNMSAPGHKGNLQKAYGYKWIDKDTEDPEQVFARMTPFNEGNFQWEENGREAIYTGLEIKKDNQNEGFLRDEASLHIVMISDEDDESRQPTLNEFIAWLDALRDKNEDQLSFSSIVGIDVPCDGSDERGQQYLDITDAIGGFEWSICKQDWEPVVDSLGLRMSGFQHEYFLSRLPVPGTIRVDVVENEISYGFVEGTDWFYTDTRNSVTFMEYIPNELAEIRITYDVLSAEQSDQG